MNTYYCRTFFWKNKYYCRTWI